MGSIFRKDLKQYMSGMYGYLIMMLQLLFAGVFTVLYNLMARSADFSLPLIAMQTVLTLLIPFLSMRAIAEERHRQTESLLLSLPLTSTEIVLGKFLAAGMLFLIPTVILGLYPLVLSSMGAVSLASAYTALLGYLLMGLAMLSLCFYLSTLTENQVVAALLGIAALVLIHLLSLIVPKLPGTPRLSFLFCLVLCLGAFAWVLAASRRLLVSLLTLAVTAIPTACVYLVCPERFTSLLPDALASVDLFSRMNELVYGRMDLRTVLFYLCFVLLFLFLSVRSFENRRTSDKGRAI